MISRQFPHKGREACGTRFVILEVEGAEAVEKQSEDDQGDDYVGPVALINKSENGEDDASYWCGDQEQQAKLNDAADVTGDGIVKNRSDVTKIAGLTLEDPVMFR